MISRWHQIAAVIWICAGQLWYALSVGEDGGLARFLSNAKLELKHWGGEGTFLY